jgi:tRNA U55 pseudouridine synthase TruB
MDFNDTLLGTLDTYTRTYIAQICHHLMYKEVMVELERKTVGLLKYADFMGDHHKIAETSFRDLYRYSLATREKIPLVWYHSRGMLRDIRLSHRSIVLSLRKVHPDRASK